MKTHFSASIAYRSRGRTVHTMDGYPVCCSGSAAQRIADAGNHTDDPLAVSCSRCLRLLDRMLAGE